MARYSVTVLSFGAPFIAVCASPGSRWGHCSNVWESLMIVVLFILVIAGVFKYRPAACIRLPGLLSNEKERKKEVGSRCCSRNIAWHYHVPFGFVRMGYERKKRDRRSRHVCGFVLNHIWLVFDSAFNIASFELAFSYVKQYIWSCKLLKSKRGFSSYAKSISKRRAHYECLDAFMLNCYDCGSERSLFSSDRSHISHRRSISQAKERVFHVRKTLTRYTRADLPLRIFFPRSRTNYHYSQGERRRSGAYIIYNYFRMMCDVRARRNLRFIAYG